MNIKIYKLRHLLFVISTYTYTNLSIRYLLSELTHIHIYLFVICYQNLQNSNANHVETIKSRQSNNRYLFVSNIPRDFKATKAVNGATVLLSIFRHS